MFEVAVVDTGETVLLRVCGELDICTAAQLDQVLAPLLSRPCELDLGEVSFTDSTGVNLLIRLQRRAASQGGTLRLVAVTRPVLRVLEITGTAGVLLLGPEPPSTRPGADPV
ncbi:anti-sigma factor antagonist [Streptomyces sp. SID8379]|uniref:STAS domain-containing protein n=1 Tax=unclassified Streptomyces TaxID=2593676 RepID=UPI00037E6F97|nr:MULTISPECIES: STAS domain-containing protein [unclassified Streptomyces]MYW64338.1 anti-sigma factor antagonist [Streptomyces sp. SID8379]